MNDRRFARDEYGETRCPMCDKQLSAVPSVGYWFDHRRFCSYACMNAANRKWQESAEYRNIQAELRGVEVREPEFRVMTDEEVEQFVALFKAGYSLTAIAAQCRRSYESVRKALRHKGLIGPKATALTAREIAEIKRRAAHGEALLAIARDLKMSKSTIGRAVRGDLD